MSRIVIIICCLFHFNTVYTQIFVPIILETNIANNTMLVNPAMTGLYGTDVSLTRNSRYGIFGQGNRLSNISFQTPIERKAWAFGASITHDEIWYQDLTAANVYASYRKYLSDESKISAGITLGGYRNYVHTTLSFPDPDSIGQFIEVIFDDEVFSYNVGMGVMWLWKHGYVSFSVPRILAPILIVEGTNGFELEWTNQRDVFLSAGFIIKPNQRLMIRPAFTVHGINFPGFVFTEGLIDLGRLDVSVDFILRNRLWLGFNINNNFNGESFTSLFEPFETGFNVGYRFKGALRVGTKLAIQSSSYRVEFLAGYRFNNRRVNDPNINPFYTHFF